MTQAKAKSNSVVTTQWSGDILTINVLGAGEAGADGVREALGLMFDRSAAHAALRDRAEQHGWTQRIVDAAAISADPKTGKVDPLAKYEAMEKVIKHYESGSADWRLATSAGAGEGTMLLRALCMVKPEKSEEQIRKFLDSRTAEQLKTIRKLKEVVQAMNQLRLEAAGDQGVEEALGELDG
jgi:hypothetical protein